MNATAFVNGNVVVLYCARSHSHGACMTLVVGICATDAIVLAADSRVTNDAHASDMLIVSDRAQKLYGVGPLGVGVSGRTGVISACLDYLRERPALVAPVDVRSEATTIGRSLFDSFTRQHDTPCTTWPNASLMLAGFEKDRTTPAIVCLHSQSGFWADPQSDGWIGTQLARGCTQLLAKTLLDEDGERPTREHAKLFGVTAVRVVSGIDLSVGGPIQLAMVTPEAYVDLGHEVPGLERHSVEAFGHVRGAFWAHARGKNRRQIK